MEHFYPCPKFCRFVFHLLPETYYGVACHNCLVNHHIFMWLEKSVTVSPLSGLMLNSLSLWGVPLCLYFILFGFCDIKKKIDPGMAKKLSLDMCPWESV